MTVCFEGDLKLLQLQARSFSEHLQNWPSARIFIVINSFDEGELYDKIMTEVVPHYGCLSRVVHVVKGTSLLPHCSALQITSRKRYGWYRQQWLKLAFSEMATSRHYIVLDTKNHFIRDFSCESFFDCNGRPYIKKMVTSGALLGYYYGSLQLLGDRQDSMRSPILPSITPFPFEKNLIMRMLGELKKMHNKSLIDFFCSHGMQISEFLLYHAFIDLKNLDYEKLFSFSGGISHTVFDGSERSIEQARSKINRSEAQEIFVFGAHRSALLNLSPIAKDFLTETWVRSNLFGDEGEVNSFLLEFKKS